MMHSTGPIGGFVWVNGHYITIENAVLLAGQWWEQNNQEQKEEVKRCIIQIM